VAREWKDVRQQLVDAGLMDEQRVAQARAAQENRKGSEAEEQARASLAREEGEHAEQHMDDDPPPGTRVYRPGRPESPVLVVAEDGSLIPTDQTNAEALLERLEPSVTPAEDRSDLREIARLVDQQHEIEEALAEQVAQVRRRGRSWGKIAFALGVSREAARQRYGEGEAQ
jgi:hypothetical protein